jgi:AhpD family alkylhydroperoxidase
MRNRKARFAIAILCATQLSGATAKADPADVQATRDDIQATLGAVPTFVGSIADAAVTGLWREAKDLQLSDKTALDPKTKALIALAVAAQIPCSYCIVSDTADAHRAGAKDQEIAEAVAIAGLTRNVSTVLNGMQVDFDTFKQEMGGM